MTCIFVIYRFHYATKREGTDAAVSSLATVHEVIGVGEDCEDMESVGEIESVHDEAYVWGMGGIDVHRLRVTLSRRFSA